MPKIVIIENLLLFREVLINFLATDSNINIVGQSAKAEDAVSLCKKLNPDLLIIDVLAENNSDGIYYAGKAKEKFPHIKVLVMADAPEISFIRKAKQYNIDSFVYKNITTTAFVNVIFNTLSGYSTFPDSSHSMATKTILSDLSDRELQILTLYCNGLNRSEITDEINISISTLKNHITSILFKTGFDSLSRLSLYCVANGYIIPCLKNTGN